MTEGSTATIEVWSSAATKTPRATTTSSHVERSCSRLGTRAPRLGSGRLVGRDDRDIFVEPAEYQPPHEVVRLAGRHGALELDPPDELVVDADPGDGGHVAAGGGIAREQREVGRVKGGLDAIAVRAAHLLDVRDTRRARGPDEGDDALA